MKARGPKPFLLVAALIVALAMPATVVAQQAPLGSQEINEFYLHPSTTQAGGHPDVHLLFRFCDAVPHIIDATNTSPIRSRRSSHTVSADGAGITVRGVRGTSGRTCRSPRRT